MKIKPVLFAVGCLFILQGAFAQTTLSGSFMYEGILRDYRAYIPAMYDPAMAVPLVFNLHGYGSNNVQQEIYGDFRPIADTAGFIIVHPNGTFDIHDSRYWNTFGNSTVDDIGFLSALIDTLDADYNIDLNRIYATGMSNGGFMSYELACGLSGRIAAIASVTGSMIYSHFSSCNASHPTPVMEIHGTADNTVPFNGNVFFVPIDTLVSYWVGYNHCLTTPTLTQIPDIDTTDGCTAELFTYVAGDAGSKVALFKIIGGEHTWPGAPFIIGVTNMDISASAEIWHFFSQYDLNGIITGIRKNIVQAVTCPIYPNPGHGNFTINCNSFAEKQITVMNLLGQIVQQFACVNDHITLTIADAGMYSITVQTGNQILTAKVLNIR